MGGSDKKDKKDKKEKKAKSKKESKEAKVVPECTECKEKDREIVGLKTMVAQLEAKLLEIEQLSESAKKLVEQKQTVEVNKTTVEDQLSEKKKDKKRNKSDSREKSSEKKSKKAKKSKSSSDSVEDDKKETLSPAMPIEDIKEDGHKYKTAMIEETEIYEEHDDDDYSPTNSNGYRSRNEAGRKFFQKVDVEKEVAEIKDERLKDNSYEGAFGANGWGYKANEVLKATKGKDFRHEKTKKKRGSYRGGAIDDGAVRSIKFNYEE